MSLDRLLSPSSVAVIGASTDPDKLGYSAMENVKGFDGPVIPVNPSASGDLFGRSFVPSITEVDGDVDLALICVPRGVVPNIIEECIEADVGGTVVYAGGFEESGEEGEHLQARIKGLVSDAELSVLGPNTSGFVNPVAGVNGSFVDGVDDVTDGNIAVVAQSGGISHVLMFQAIADDVGLSMAVGLGNTVDVDFPSMIDYLDGDEHTEAILLHVEGSSSARRLVKHARDASIPVVAYKIGRTDVGEFAASHTGSLIGEYDLYQAAFEQYGVTTVDSCQELLDAGLALSKVPVPAGPNVALITAQAGPGIAITDRLKRVGARLPELTAETREAISDIVPDTTYGRNPVDIGKQSPEFDAVIDAVGHDDRIDILFLYELYEVDYPMAVLERLIDDVGKPIIFATNGPDPAVADGIETMREMSIPAYRSPERGAEAVGVLVQHTLRNDGTDETEPTAEERRNV